MSGRALRFSRMPGKFAVCRLSAGTKIPDWAWSGTFGSVTRTEDEVSIVCAADNIPEAHQPKSPWICFKIEGPFSFSEVGILASVINPLAEKKVPIFAISTFDTDYVLVGEEYAGIALQVLRDAGHEFLP